MDACEALFEAGVSEDDGRILLGEAARQGRLGTVRRLLEAEVRVDHVPLCRSLDVIQTLLEHGAELDPTRFQKYAAEVGSLEMLKWLVARYGPSIPTDHDGELFDILREANMDLLRYLITEYGHNSQRFTSLHTGISTDILRMAPNGSSVDKVQMLLHEGAVSGCPGFPHIAFEILRDRLRERPYGQFVNAGDIRIFQQLLVHSDGEHGGDNTDVNKLWLTPALLPSELFNELSMNSDWWCSPRTGWLNRKPSQKRKLSSNSTKVFASKASSRAESEDISEDDAGDSTPRENKPLLHPPPTSSSANDEGFVYEELEGLYTLRLVILEPSQHMESPIRCQLIHANLAGDPEYEALSYVWGDPMDKVAISLQNTETSVTRNLWNALCRLRLADKPRTLWVDAICIDQSNIEERNQQVGIMRQIYQ